jgi:hypothetical protein
MTDEAGALWLTDQENAKLSMEVLLNDAGELYVAMHYTLGSGRRELIQDMRFSHGDRRRLAELLRGVS